MKLAELLIAGVLVASINTSVMAKGASSSGGRSSSSSSRSSSSRPSPSPSPSPSTATATSTSKPAAYSSTKSYATGKGNKVGKAPLKSKTTPPAAHDHNGTKYNSSTAPYTNSSGGWVFWWIPVGTTIQCFDKEHKRITCNRDDKSYQKDW